MNKNELQTESQTNIYIYNTEFINANSLLLIGDIKWFPIMFTVVSIYFPTKTPKEITVLLEKHNAMVAFVVSS